MSAGNKYARVTMTPEIYSRMKTLADKRGMNSVTELVNKVVAEVAGQQQDLTPAGLMPPVSAPAVNQPDDDNDKLRTPYDADLAADIKKRKQQPTEVNHGRRNRIPYAVRGNMAYPVHKGKAGVRMCVVDDDLVGYDLTLRRLDPDIWDDVTDSLSPFENGWLDAWREGFDWMMKNYVQLLEDKDHKPSMMDYYRLLTLYHEHKERDGV